MGLNGAHQVETAVLSEKTGLGSETYVWDSEEADFLSSEKRQKFSAKHSKGKKTSFQSKEQEI